MGYVPLCLDKKSVFAIGDIDTLQAGTTRCLLHAKTQIHQGKKNVSNFTPFRVGGPLKRPAVALYVCNITNIPPYPPLVQRNVEKIKQH